MKNIIYLLTSMVILAYACSPMDDNYKDFVDDGPITYISRLKDAGLKATGERNRVRFTWPKLEDPRGVKVEITWSNKMGSHTEPIDPSKETDFYINDLAEASYIFEITVIDGEGNRSIPVSATATVYGATWESYLSSRSIVANAQNSTYHRITYRKNTDRTLLGTEFEWTQDGATMTAYIDSSQMEGYLNGFKVSSFRHRTRYIPEEGGVDVFYSPWSYFEMTETEVDRNDWYVPMETDHDGNDLANVNYGSSAAAVADKIKSPYLSHLLPWSNSNSTPASGGADGANSARAHIDSRSDTYLSMVKGIGTDATSGTAHANGGVTLTGVGDKPWFIIRLDENTPEKFNYFRLRYRENGSNGSNLKPQGLTFFGSNDDNCITDDSQWTQINTEVIIPDGSKAASTQPPATSMGTFAPGANLESGNMALPATFEFRYVKVQIDNWETSSNTIQIGEFYLGYYF